MTTLERSPAVEHALLTGHPGRAAAIHVLDGIDSWLFPRAAVTMDGIGWEQIADVGRMLSGGEYILAVAAQQLDNRGSVGWSTLEEIRRRVDQAGNARVDEAMRMVGQRIPLDVSGPVIARGSGAAGPDDSGRGAAASHCGGRAVESPPDRDILDQDPLLDDTARETIWDRR